MCEAKPDVVVGVRLGFRGDGCTATFSRSLGVLARSLGDVVRSLGETPRSLGVPAYSFGETPRSLGVLAYCMESEGRLELGGVTASSTGEGSGEEAAVRWGMDSRWNTGGGGASGSP